MGRRPALTHLFEALYGPLAPAYDAISLAFFAGEWTEWQRRAIDLVRGTDVLEIGYGTGSAAVELAARGHRVWGVDSSRQMRLLATRKLQRHGLRAELLRAPAQALPFAPAGFDTVLSTFPSSYILDQRTWAEVHRVLRPAGRFVVLLGGELRPTGAYARALRGFHRLVYGPSSPPPFGALTVEGFELREMALHTSGGVAYVVLAERLPAAER